MELKFLQRIEEKNIKNKPNLIGHKDVFDSCCSLLKYVHKNEAENLKKLFEELDIRSVFLFYGKTGTGKTTLAYSILESALSLGIESYQLEISEMIETDLGKTLQNFENAWKEIINFSNKNDDGFIILMDEFDRFEINRKQENEISELKRAFISLMDFIESIKISDKITLIATTNSYDTLDEALKRRFSFIYEIKCSEEMKTEYINNIKDILIEANINVCIDEKLKEKNSIAEIKRQIREIVMGKIQKEASQ